MHVPWIFTLLGEVRQEDPDSTKLVQPIDRSSQPCTDSAAAAAGGIIWRHACCEQLNLCPFNLAPFLCEQGTSRSSFFIFNTNFY